MTEYSEHISAADVLESSELAARLIRRLTSPPGVINTRGVVQRYARLTEWIPLAHPLLHDLLRRYSIDDGSSFRSLPLVTDAQSQLNVNAHLTNNNSLLSTTNNFFSAPANEFPPAALSSSSSTSASVHSSSRQSSGPEAKMFMSGQPSEPRQTETFRVSRNPAHRSRQGVPLDVEDVATQIEEDTRRREEVEEMAKGKQIRSHVSTPTSLPLARTRLAESGIQQVTKEDDKERRRFVSDTIEARHEAKLAQAIFARTNSAATSSPRLTLNQAKPARRDEPVVSEASTEQPLTATEPSPETTPFPVLPLVQAQNPASQFQTRPPQFVWRKSEDSPTMRDLISDLSSSGPLAAVREALDALPVAQSQPGNQSVKPVPPGREYRPGTEEITTEGMVRRISTMLLIERERRGY